MYTGITTIRGYSCVMDIAVVYALLIRKSSLSTVLNGYGVVGVLTCVNHATFNKVCFYH